MATETLRVRCAAHPLPCRRCPCVVPCSASAGLAVCCGHVAPRARLPLFHFRPPPLPCPWTAAMRSSGAAGLLPWLLAPAGKCGCPALYSPLRPLLHGPLRAMSAQQLCYAAASSLVPAGRCSPAAACGQQPTDAGGLLAPSSVLLRTGCRLQPTHWATGATFVPPAPSVVMPLLQTLL